MCVASDAHRSSRYEAAASRVEQLCAAKSACAVAATVTRTRPSRNVVTVKPPRRVRRGGDDSKWSEPGRQRSAVAVGSFPVQPPKTSTEPSASLTAACPTRGRARAVPAESAAILPRRSRWSRPARRARTRRRCSRLRPARPPTQQRRRVTARGTPGAAGSGAPPPTASAGTASTSATSLMPALCRPRTARFPTTGPNAPSRRAATRPPPPSSGAEVSAPSPSLLQQLAVLRDPREAEIGEPGLARPEEGATTADLEILLGELEAVVDATTRRAGRARSRSAPPSGRR